MIDPKDVRTLKALSSLTDEVQMKFSGVEATLQGVGSLMDSLPNLDDLQDIDSVLGSIVSSLERIQSLWQDLPAVDDLADLDRALGDIVESLEQIPRLAEQVPNADTLS